MGAAPGVVGGSTVYMLMLDKSYRITIWNPVSNGEVSSLIY